MIACSAVSAAEISDNGNFNDNNTSVTTVASTSNQASVVISGEVKKCSNGDPFPGVVIKALNNGTELASAITKADGTYTLGFINNNRLFSVTASYPGHEPSIKEVSVNNGVNNYGTANFKLGTSSVYVNPYDGKDEYPGTFSKPFKTIAKAISEVSENGTIYLNPGIYSGTYNRGLTINKSLNIKPLYGNVIIDAGGENSIFSIANMEPDIKVNIWSIILRGGNSSYGGAINIGKGTYHSSIVELNYCIFQNNYANYGGAIYNNMGNIISIKNCTFIDNQAINGGAIYNDLNGILNINENIFVGNNATGLGGAIFAGDGNCTINRCTFMDNQANQGGAISKEGSGICTVQFNRILNNNATDVYSSVPNGINAENNWWGNNFQGTNPQNAGRINSNVVANTWIILSLTANPSLIINGSTSTITADLSQNNLGPSGGFIPDKYITVNFNNLNGLGTLSTNSGPTLNGLISSVFTANDYGNEQISASIDGFTVNTPVMIKIPTKLILNELTAYKGKTIKLTATLWDTYQNKAISGQKVIFKVSGGIIGSGTTNSNGVATILYKDLTGKKQTINAEFNGSKEYLNSSNTNQIIGEKTFTLTIKNNGKNKIHAVYYVTLYQPGQTKAILKTYKFDLNPGKSKKINIGTYPIGTAISIDELVYNTANTKKTVSLINTWTTTGLKTYMQKFVVKNVPAKQSKAAITRNRFWINKDVLNVLIVKKPGLVKK